MEDELEVTEGIKFDRGYISPYFMTETKGLKCQYENALVLINQTKISDIQPLVPALELAAKSQRPIVIIAEDIDSGNFFLVKIYLTFYLFKSLYKFIIFNFRQILLIKRHFNKINQIFRRTRSTCFEPFKGRS